MRLSITLDEDLLGIDAEGGDTDGITVRSAGYGWVIEPGHREWAIVVQFTGRQDGKVSWGVTLTDVDGLCSFVGRLTLLREAAAAIGGGLIELTQQRRWTGVTCMVVQMSQAERVLSEIRAQGDDVLEDRLEYDAEELQVAYRLSAADAAELVRLLRKEAARG